MLRELRWLHSIENLFRMSFFGRRPRYGGVTRKAIRPLPCRLCAFAVTITASHSTDHGKLCIWYGVRLSADELKLPRCDVRNSCIRDGNNFQWPIRGYSTKQLLEQRMNLTDWYLQRNSTSTQRLASILSLVLSGMAIGVTVVSWFLKAGL